jgi:hypothetical protein
MPFATDLSDYYAKMHVALEGNLTSMNDMRNTYKILGENPEVKRPTQHYLTQFT